MIRKCFVFTVDNISEVFKIQKNDSISILFLVTGGDNKLRRLNSDDTIDIVADVDLSSLMGGGLTSIDATGTGFSFTGTPSSTMFVDDAAAARTALGLPTVYKASIIDGNPPTVNYTVVNQFGVVPVWTYNPTAIGGYRLTMPGCFTHPKNSGLRPL